MIVIVTFLSLLGLARIKIRTRKSKEPGQILRSVKDQKTKKKERRKTKSPPAPPPNQTEEEEETEEERNRLEEK